MMHSFPSALYFLLNPKWQYFLRILRVWSSRRCQGLGLLVELSSDRALFSSLLDLKECGWSAAPSGVFVGACRAGRAGKNISPCAVQQALCPALGTVLHLVQGERQRCGDGKRKQLQWSLLFKGNACCLPHCLSASWGISVSVATARFSLLKAEFFPLLFAGSGNSSLSSSS